MNETPNYYAVIPASVRYCTELTGNEKLLYGEITALCSKSGECWATNHYFAGLYDVDERTIRRWISNLVRLGFLESIVSKDDGNARYLRIPQGKNALTLGQNCPDPLGQKCPNPQGKNVRQNNTRENNTRFNIKNILRNTIPEGNTITSYAKKPDVSPTGDVLAGKRATTVTEYAVPRMKTKPEDYGLVDFALQDIVAGDWERLLNWFEYHRREKTGKALRPYVKSSFKQYADLLRELSDGNWYYAMDAVEFAVNSCYRGFGDSDGFFYKLKSKEDYELEISLAKDFATHPEDLPERVQRYKPLVMEWAVKACNDRIAQLEGLKANQQSELATIDPNEPSNKQRMEYLAEKIAVYDRDIAEAKAKIKRYSGEKKV